MEGQLASDMFKKPKIQSFQQTTRIQHGPNGFENFCISYEKKLMLNLDPSEEGKKIRSLTLRNGFENAGEANRDNVSQIWNSQYFQGESLVVVSDGNYDDLEEHKPLGLPIRSLRSRIGGAEKPEITNRSFSSSSLKRSFNNDNEGRVEKVRGMTPTNLHNKFEEVVGTSTIPWKSRSERMEMRKDIGNFVEPPGHSRPHSVGEFEFKQLKSRSFRQPVSSCNSSKSFGSRMSTSSSSASPEPSNLKTENVEQKRDLKVARDSISHSSVANLNSGFTFTSKKDRGFSIGSSSELDLQKGSKDDSEDFSREVKYLLGRGKRSSESMMSSDAAKPSNLSKFLSRAKSVRTIRSGRYVAEKIKRKEKYSNEIPDEVEAVDEQFAESSLMDTETAELKDPQVDIQKENLDKVHSPGSEKKQLIDSDLASEESTEESQSESENSQESSDDNEHVSDEVNDEELAGSEVDRKADEFIAKFREQIRLQKIGSARKHTAW
ncbi:hypothetical protein M9H77_33482 [Catharanthus roseus]|uniref:Uncharacterized protein n=1 Tax=Catharanthus roseus TaxID=4058 RepID=A0ACB9ZMP3_CATRO|nr:hypothetical protein M9H77_33482 [Catharanthus roseus]